MWLYENKEFLEENINDFVGFVYKIKNLETGKMYIGKKRFYTKVSKPPLKGKKRRRISRKFSDWQTYYGSNENIKKDVELIGANNFSREILRLCKTLGEMSYYEAKYQFEFDVLRSPMWYNEWIAVKVHQKHLKC